MKSVNKSLSFGGILASSLSHSVLFSFAFPQWSLHLIFTTDHSSCDTD